MADEYFSSIKSVVKVVKLVVPITYISNEYTGVLETLESWKRQYNSQLEGILVNFCDVSLISRANNVVSDKFCIIIDVKAKFFLFCPNVGDVVRGKINRISREYVGCIMHDTINATIFISGFHSEGLKKYLRLEHEIFFEITHFDCLRYQIRVKGRITPYCLERMTELYPDVEEEKLTNASFQNHNSHYTFPDDIEECPIFKSDFSVEPPIINIDASSVTHSEGESSDSVNKKSKKRKRGDSPTESSEKKKHKKAKHLQHNVSTNEFSNSNGNLEMKVENNLNNKAVTPSEGESSDSADKKSKKHKWQDSPSEPSGKNKHKKAKYLQHNVSTNEFSNSNYNLEMKVENNLNKEAVTKTVIDHQTLPVTKKKKLKKEKKKSKKNKKETTSKRSDSSNKKSKKRKRGDSPSKLIRKKKHIKAKYLQHNVKKKGKEKVKEKQRH